ncbi:hypothetical protein ENBRE01_0250 [Enteropsectra breve]|nr:hypothetical protein ENBRE01_0250 [Enteropsectra breve]
MLVSNPYTLKFLFEISRIIFAQNYCSKLFSDIFLQGGRPMLWEFFKTTAILVLIVGLIGAIGVGAMRSIDFIEENPYAAREKIQKAIYAVIAAHALFLFLRVPILHILFSLSIQYAFNTLFHTYPFIKVEDPKFIYGIIASLVNHFLLIRFFINASYGLLFIAISFVIIWATPLSFFFSMSASDDALFDRSSGKATRTYVGLFLEYLMKLGKGKAHRNE